MLAYEHYDTPQRLLVCPQLHNHEDPQIPHGCHHYVRRQMGYNHAPPPLAEALPASGMTQKYPYVVVYSPLKYQGLGIIQPFYWQEITHIISVLRESCMPSITGDLLWANMEQLRLKVGVRGTRYFCVRGTRYFCNRLLDANFMAILWLTCISNHWYLPSVKEGKDFWSLSYGHLCTNIWIFWR
jgi:hypothetical protein